MSLLKKRENSTMVRLENTQKAVAILKTFISMGFKSLPSIVSITQHYSPEITRDELLSFWHFRKVNTDFVAKMEIVMNKLKAE